MNLSWDAQNRRFIAEFSTDFNGDLAAVKEAGFRTDGSPGWIWYSYKAGPLAKLRGKVNLTITAEAREQFTSLWTVEEKNAKLKAELAAYNKTLKKKLKIEDQDEKALAGPKMRMCSEGYMCISVEDLPPLPPFKHAYISTAVFEKFCFICKAGLLPWEELSDPPACAWCEKLVLDNAETVC